MRNVSVCGGISDIIDDTIESLRDEMIDVNSFIVFDAKDVHQEASDVDTELASEDNSHVSDIPSDKVIRNQKEREKERKRRHKRAKHRLRRAKNGR